MSDRQNGQDRLVEAFLAGYRQAVTDFRRYAVSVEHRPYPGKGLWLTRTGRVLARLARRAQEPF